MQSLNIVHKDTSFSKNCVSLQNQYCLLFLYDISIQTNTRETSELSDLRHMQSSSFIRRQWKSKSAHLRNGKKRDQISTILMRFPTLKPYTKCDWPIDTMGIVFYSSVIG